MNTAVSLLKEHGADFAGQQHIIDKWFIPKSVHSREEHDTWFDQDHGVAYRIRQLENADGEIKLVLDSKQHTEANNHNTFKEDTLPFKEEAEMLAYLEKEGYYNWLTIDKTRRLFTSPKPNLVISMDSISGIKDKIGIDTVLEIEYSGDMDRHEAVMVIGDFAHAIGLDNSDQFDKSLTVESMKVLAKFQ